MAFQPGASSPFTSNSKPRLTVPRAAIEANSPGRPMIGSLVTWATLSCSMRNTASEAFRRLSNQAPLTPTS